MKLFLISQNQNNEFNTYDSAVVAAPDEETAKWMNPINGKPIDDWGLGKKYYHWCNGPEYVTVRYLGEAVGDVEQGVVCASYIGG